MKHLITVLTESIKKHGADKPLTLGHLLNIVLLAEKVELVEEKFLDELDTEARNEAFHEKHKY